MAERSTLAVRDAVRRALADIGPGELVLVACSGGADSLALGAAAAFVGPRAGWRAGGVVVDHQLQPDSAEVARWAAGVCGALGLGPVTVRPVRVGSAGGPEAAAREARYDGLLAEAQASGAAAVLLGHTLDDQAETVLLRLARGSGARSLAAMAPRSGLWRRPLLELPRAVVHASAREALASVGEAPWVDPHNADARFARVRVRESMGTLARALGPGIAGGLSRSASLLRDDADALDAWAQREMDEHASGGRIAVPALAALPRAVRTRVLRRMCIAAGALAGDLTHDHVATVERLVSEWSGQGPTSLPGGIAVSRSAGWVSVGPAPPRLRAPDVPPTQE
ncbi:MAG: tRNA lysidine(34) synthetase TilS [Actinobacteria bacterium]|uniref:tRNA(Ile)-lysidine synthetase n=1 Tax=freshwater metagenome TaxID=449393 RepID=A0A6J7J4M9_9ZZZZ|nr:tRNA lysidine(34) synthetase TilS [Actinomycetota bacterium]